MPNDEPAPKHDHNKLPFPEDFLWGAATSAYQIEGNNASSDWWAFEQTLDPTYQSKLAADSYNKFEEDFTLAKQLLHNSHRLSLEWSRIEPAEGQFDEGVIAHYKQVLQFLKNKQMKIMLTLWHFTLPEWLAKKGGFENPNTIHYFERFVRKVVPEYKDFVDLWITVNEPGIYAWAAFIGGKWPPNKKSWLIGLEVFWNIAKTHKRAYKAIHELVPEAQVGISQNAVSFENQQAHSIVQHILVWYHDLINNHLFYKFSGIKTHDFLGVNYYFHQRIGSHNGSKFPKVLDAAMIKLDVSDMGWEIYPEGIFDVLTDFADYKKPIYITEAGIATTNDDRRSRFLVSYLKEVYHALESGIEVKGFFYWSLIDNFEWLDGFRPRFGLIEVDYTTEERKIRPSAYLYAEIIRHKGIPHHLLKFIGHSVTVPEVLSYDHHCPNELCPIVHLTNP